MVIPGCFLLTGRGLFGTPKKPLRLASDMHLKESVEAIDKLQRRLKVVSCDDTLRIMLHCFSAFSFVTPWLAKGCSISIS